MKTKAIVAIVIVAFLAVAIIALGLGLGVNAKQAIDNSSPTPFLSDWMSYLKNDILVKNTVIPGSHDAGTKDMNWMAETQNRTIEEQLASGSRYFDLRAWKKGDDLFVFHGPIRGMKFAPIVDEINDFLNAHPTEFIIIDMQKFKGDSQEDVAALLYAKLGDKIVKNNTSSADIDFIDSLTVEQMRGKCLVFWGDLSTVNIKDFLFLRNNDHGNRPSSTLSSFYYRKYNTLASSSYIKKGIPKYLEMHKENPKGLFVLQCQLTDPVFIIGPKAIEALHTNNMKEYLNHFDFINNQLNIVIRDYIGPKKCADIIVLNLGYSNIKDSLVNEFSTNVFNVGL